MWRYLLWFRLIFVVIAKNKLGSRSCLFMSKNHLKCWNFMKPPPLPRPFYLFVLFIWRYINDSKKLSLWSIFKGKVQHLLKVTTILYADMRGEILSCFLNTWKFSNSKTFPYCTLILNLWFSCLWYHFSL